MDILGELNLKHNVLKNGHLEKLTELPSDPKVGTWAFYEKQLMLCVEMEDKPVWVPLTQARNTYLYETHGKENVWNIPHALKSEQVLVQCFDAQNKVIVPDTVEILDADNVVVSFPEDVEGTAIVMFGYTAGMHIDGEFKDTASNRVGRVFWVMKSDKLPSDVLPLMGQTITREYYPQLVTYLEGEEADTATLADARSVFVRNLDFGKGVDTDRLEGSIQEGQAHKHSHSGSVSNKDLGSKSTNTKGSHSHTIRGRGKDGNTYNGDPDLQGRGGTTRTSRASNASGNHAHSITLGSHNHGLTINESGSDDGRPKNIAYMLVVQAK